MIGVDPELALAALPHPDAEPLRARQGSGGAPRASVIRIDPDTGRGLSIERLRVPSPPEPSVPVLILDGKAVAAKVLADVKTDVAALAESTGAPAHARGDPGRRGSRLPGVRAQQEAERRGGRHRLARLPLPAGVHAGGAARHHRGDQRGSVDSRHPAPAPAAQGLGRGRGRRRHRPRQGRRRAPPDEPRQPPRAASRRRCRARRRAVSRSSTTTGSPIEGAEAVVVGRSRLVGKPLAQLLLGRHATVTMCHTRTRDLAGHCRRADILCVAAGPAALRHRRHGEGRRRRHRRRA